jgi:hypothetical protein
MFADSLFETRINGVYSPFLNGVGDEARCLSGHF